MLNLVDEFTQLEKVFSTIEGSQIDARTKTKLVAVLERPAVTKCSILKFYSEAPESNYWVEGVPLAETYACSETPSFSEACSRNKIGTCSKEKTITKALFHMPAFNGLHRNL